MTDVNYFAMASLLTAPGWKQMNLNDSTHQNNKRKDINSFWPSDRSAKQKAPVWLIFTTPLSSKLLPLKSLAPSSASSTKRSGVWISFHKLLFYILIFPLVASRGYPRTRTLHAHPKSVYSKRRDQKRQQLPHYRYVKMNWDLLRL